MSKELLIESLKNIKILLEAIKEKTEGFPNPWEISEASDIKKALSNMGVSSGDVDYVNNILSDEKSSDRDVAKAKKYVYQIFDLASGDKNKLIVKMENQRQILENILDSISKLIANINRNVSAYIEKSKKENRESDFKTVFKKYKKSKNKFELNVLDSYTAIITSLLGAAEVLNDQMQQYAEKAIDTLGGK